MTEFVYAKKQPIWVNISFFTFTTLVGLIGAPLYAMKYGVSPSLILLTVFFIFATGGSITSGYHRLFAHTTYSAHPIVNFLLLFFGAGAFEQSTLDWASQHRDHHLYVDTDKDPYSIKKGFWYAHIGWLTSWKHTLNYDNVKDLQKNRMLMHQTEHYHLWAMASGVVLPTLIGALMGQALGAFIFAVCLRLTIVYHSTFCINSVCHMFGKSTYDPESTAKDHWMVALLTFGEGYHNFHHRFPLDFRNGIRWYDYDPSKWLIFILSKVGLAYDLKKVSEFRILEARLEGENQNLHTQIHKNQVQAKIDATLEAVRQKHTQVCEYLKYWEGATRDHRELLHSKMKSQSTQLSETTLKNVEETRAKFVSAHQDWKQLVNLAPQFDRQKLSKYSSI